MTSDKVFKVNLFNTTLQKMKDIEKESVFDAIALIKRATGPDILNHGGVEVAENVLNECHLSPNAALQDTATMELVLRDLAELVEQSGGDPDRVPVLFAGVTSNYLFRGTKLDRLPGKVYRYLNGDGFFQYISDQSRAAGLGDFAAELERELAVARSNRDWRELVRIITDEDVWDDLPRDRIHLARASVAFVSFDIHPGHVVDRSSSELLHRALALAFPRSDCFVEVSYDLPPGAEIRIPTFCDAGWFKHFRASKVGDRCGWTYPHRAPAFPAVSPTPEAVVSKPTLQLIDRNAIRLVP